ncbi:hypothetical protein KSE_67740 [Kitasatospora setae KM-6054]|uniref:Uncharacterized protein n=1 Tax=Kitasatospora setae (strain ATCC 33774 / DSM 43861 / JCM 3304 / KCC A-0304 / NBRC 14216 / KM-6054) TaxID=452652 RepID=E4N2Z8_KITSK|nr:hypothetical protein KSE_67740 [Kitasatospora setae KM-6054]
MRTGRSNAHMIEMARRHCLRMEFIPFGGQGLAEEATGLPINMRRVSCPVALGNASMNLAPVVGDFYEKHCVGCELRQPTGDVPNLATLMEENKAAAAAARETSAERMQQRHAEWAQRAERRRALRVTADPAMAGALDDIGVLDADPAAQPDGGAAGARRRLAALAQRSAALFTAPVIDLAVDLAGQHNVIGLLTPLRHLARNRPEHAPAVLEAAMAVLRRAPVPDAGRCLADLLPTADQVGLDDNVVEALVYLAEPPQDSFAVPRPGGAGDASGLRAAADIAPERVAAVLDGMLPRPAAPAGLLLPAGSSAVPQEADGDGRRCAAASAIAALAQTHLDTVTPLAAPLLLSLGVDSADSYDLEPIGTTQHALAAILVLGDNLVAVQVEAAGQGAGQQVRERLIGVLDRAASVLQSDDRRRTAREVALDASRRQGLFDYLLTTALTRAGGDWGTECRALAARLIETLAQEHPAWALPKVPAILGGALLAVADLEQVSQASAAAALTTTGTMPVVLQALERMNHQTLLGSTVQTLVRAVEHTAQADAASVCQAVVEAVANDRASQQGDTVTWYLLRSLGQIGAQHGQQPQVLHTIVPTLHTYLVDADASLRAVALTAWATIGTRHRLPSSVSDLLPVLTDDAHIVVIDAVLGAAISLEWGENERIRLLLHALTVCREADARKHTGTLKKAMAALAVLTRSDGDAQQAAIEQTIVQRATELDGYDLRDALRRTWQPATTTSPTMAALRLRQARDQQINDRFNQGDDEELCALLDCGAGLAALPTADLETAALELGPDRPLAAAEFAEVAWRAARSADAATILTAVLAATPDTPAYRIHRALVSLLAAAAAQDDAWARPGTAPEATALAAAAAALDAADGGGSSLAQQARLRIRLRDLLAGSRPADQGSDPAAALRQRAALLQEAAAGLKSASMQATTTAAYLRGYADLCDLAYRLLLLDAAELDADHTTVASLTAAVGRRAALLADELRDRFDELDPLAGALVAAVQQAGEVTDGSAVADTLTAWARLPLPVPVVAGPRRLPHRLRPAQADEPVPDPDVAVVLASIDDQLVTGPQVLRPSTVYELRLDVQPGPWPDWAQTLEADLLSHFTPTEAQTPAYVWPRPAQPGQETFSEDGTLILRFGLPAGRPSPPFLVRLRWRGIKDGREVVEDLDVAGHREIRCRPFDASRDFLTDFPVFDERLLALYERLHESGYDEDHLQAFCRLFTAICRIGLRMTWNKQYKRGTSVTERKFHDDLYADLQAEPELGGRLQRGTPLALGYLDVRHDKITAELKVERKTPVTKATAPKYMGQPTQYAAADGARLSILCILDMSRKTSPVGVPENYLFTLEPALHGLANPEAPSLVAAIVVNANLPTPSSWSRRRTATQPTP